MSIPVESVQNVEEDYKLEDVLKKYDTESEEDFQLRSAYTYAAKKAFPDYPTGTYINMGNWSIQRAKYGQTYADNINAVLDHLDNFIKENM